MSAFTRHVRITDFVSVHTGPVGQAFTSLFNDWRGCVPYVLAEGLQLRDYWMTGRGHTEEAAALSASLELRVEYV